MEQVVKVAVAAATFAIDKDYDYLVPESLGLEAKPGARVLLPFSRGNRRTEGVVLDTVAESQYKGLKYIDKIIDSEPLITQEQLKLAKWMRTRFFCTVYEALRAILPVGLWFETEDYCELCSGLTLDEALTKVRDDKELFAFLLELSRNSGKAKLHELKTRFGTKTSKIIKKLIELEIIVVHTRSRMKVSEKNVTVAQLLILRDEAVEIALRKKRSAPMQSEILKLLADVNELPIKEITYLTGAGSSSIKPLERLGYISLIKREIFRRPQHSPSARDELPISTLNTSQQKCREGLKSLLYDKEARAALLYGVTGSGKTAVYIKLINDTLEIGKTAIVLVPEIALTPQLLSTFSLNFGDNVAVMHSSLSMGERFDEWRRIKSGKASVVVGTRSAVFAPVENLGLIIIDEEQESTYKSESSPRYHARDIAKYLCVENKALLLLGSATPAVESMYSARQGRYSLFNLEGRYNEMKLPEVIIADMKADMKEGNGGAIGEHLRRELEINLNKKEQSILFINRRGANNIIACPECGHVFRCPNCSVNLTYHSANKRMMCHYCGYSEKAGDSCSNCNGMLKYIGYGTQKVETELNTLFPDVRIIRMDADTVSALHSHEAILTKFTEEKIPILIGTQMVTKGLNFENVTLVGVISADQSLYSSDYRAHERTFSMITQVVGRSGRGQKAGRAVIQTFTPDNEVIRLAANQDYNAFYEREIKVRELLGSPPVAELYSLTVSGYDEKHVLRCCYELRAMLEASIRGMREIRVMGPAPVAIVKVKNRYRYRVLISCRSDPKIRAVISASLRQFASDKRFKNVSVFGDVNPMD